MGNTEAKLIEGYVGPFKVKAYVYNGADSGLSHYYVEGRKGAVSGVVNFDSVTRETQIKR